MSNYKKVHQSAVVIIPPRNTWDQIQTIRAVHDKSFKRWMPHINLIYPFVPALNFASVVDQVSKSISSFAPFQINFDELGHFGYKVTSTMFVRPKTKSNELILLQNSLQNAFPQFNDISNLSPQGYTPHLSLGQFNPKDITETLKKFQSLWTPFTFTVSEIFLISRNGIDDPFVEFFRVPLSGAPYEELIDRKLLDVFKRTEEDKAKEYLCKVFVGNLPFQTTENDLNNWFKQFNLHPVNIVLPKQANGSGKGIGFVQFSSQQEANAAIENANQQTLHNRPIAVRTVTKN